ncbi:MAG: hypothetical protein HYZ28_05850 [Myxococcales bacterium]|nr:hypothetical protein [Myxococcales bacterium]
MPRISGITQQKARELAQYIGTKYGNGNDILSRAETSRALAAAARDPVLAAKLRDVFGSSAPPGAQALLRALFERAPSPQPGAVSAGTRPGGPGAISLQADGTFSLGQTPAGSDPVRTAGVLYEAALLVAHGVNPYEKANPAQRQRALAYLEEVARAGAQRAEREMTPSESTMAMKSGSATALLSLAESAGSPAEAQVRQRAIDTYLSVAEKEIHRGLKVSMSLNLDALKDKLQLSGAQKTRLSALVSAALPTRPPYEDWFKGGNQTVRIKQYVHSDYWDLHFTPYRERGFKMTELPGGKLLWEKTVKDPTGRNPDTHFRIEVAKVADYSTDRKMLQDMSDPETHVQVYTGHSNLGGNIAAALKAAPQTEVGTKLTFLWMCRGKQNVADFSNRFPNSHLITTHVPPDGYSMVPMMGALVDMVSKRGDYASMAAQGDRPGYHMFPYDRRLYDHRDLDRDGKLDGGGVAHPDRVFDIYPRAPHGKRVDFQPGEPVDPAKLDGGAAVNALGFANTLLTYHVEHGDGRSPITAAYGDHFFSEGFYKSEGNELLRITPQEIGGKTYYSVAINSRYSGQSEEALGMAALYELNRFVTDRERGGPLTLDDKIRGLLLSAEYLAYMVGAGDYADSLVLNLARANGWPSAVTLHELLAAIEKDSHGYVSMDSINELKRRLGAQLGDGSGIR